MKKHRKNEDTIRILVLLALGGSLAMPTTLEAQAYGHCFTEDRVAEYPFPFEIPTAGPDFDPFTEKLTYDDYMVIFVTSFRYEVPPHFDPENDSPELPEWSDYLLVPPGTSIGDPDYKHSFSAYYFWNSDVNAPWILKGNVNPFPHVPGVFKPGTYVVIPEVGYGGSTYIYYTQEEPVEKPYSLY